MYPASTLAGITKTVSQCDRILYWLTRRHPSNQCFPKDYRILLPPLTRVLSVNTSGPLAKVTKPVIPTHSLQGTVCTSETIYRARIISAVVYDLEVWTLSKCDENTLVIWERNILRKIFGPVKENGVCGSAPIKS
jgi:hypothetical protein